MSSALAVTLAVPRDAGQRLSGFDVGVGDGREDGARNAAGDAFGVERPHPAGADEPDPHGSRGSEEFWVR